MKTTRVYIDGQAGTTGLRLRERIQNRTDIELLTIDPAKHRDTAERARLINESDVTFFCLPSNAAAEAVTLVQNPDVRIIDASAAHRTDPEWVYGFPELSAEYRERIRTAKRVAVPGCYASGFVSLVYPMIRSGLMPPDYPVTCHGVGGYSSGGREVIARYESPDRPASYDSARLYALGQKHKHLAEMQKIPGLSFTPIFNPIRCTHHSGMAVSVPLYTRLLNGQPGAAEIRAMFAKHYAGQRFVRVCELYGDDVLEERFLPSNTLAGTNMLEIIVFGNDERVQLVARFDNLGKGASGAAIQCFNLMTGAPEETGLV